MPVPVCRFARATFCRRFRGEARYGKDHADRQTFYGFRLHARLTWPGVISEVVPGPGQRLGAVRAAAPGRVRPGGLRRPGRPQLLRPRGSRSGWRRTGQTLLTPPARQARHDPSGGARASKWPYSDTRYRIDCGLRPVDRPLPRQAGVGQGPVAPDGPPLPQGAGPHASPDPQHGAGQHAAPVRPTGAGLKRNLHTALARAVMGRRCG